MTTTREAEKFIVRMPEGLRDQIRASATTNRRSMNAEMIFHLERAILEIEEKQKGEVTA